MCVECVCGYAQVWYRNVEGDWRVGDVCLVNVVGLETIENVELSKVIGE